MHNQVALAFLIPALLAILKYVSSRDRHNAAADGADIFRLLPFAGWFVTIVFLAATIWIGYMIITSEPTPMDAPLFGWVGGTACLLAMLYGIYSITLRIRVDEHALHVSSLFRRRVTYFSDIRSATDKVTGQYRTLDVINTRGKRVLRVTSSFLPEYDDLVSLVQTRAQEHGAEDVSYD